MKNERLSLDSMIKYKRETVFRLHSIDCVSEQYDAEYHMLEMLYQNIAEEAKELKDNGKYDYNIKKSIKHINLKTRIKMICRKIDKVLQYIPLYKNTIRVKLIRVYLKVKNRQPSVNLLVVLHGSDEAVVDNLYRIILEREADIEGKTYHINLLTTHQVSRLELAVSFNNCKETHRIKKFKGVWRAKLLYGRR